MKVLIEQGREADQVVARIEGAIALFPKRERNPIVGSTAEVMITGYKMSDRPGARQVPYMFFVRLLRSDDRLVHHRGFEMSGTMCSTTAYCEDEDISFLTPGRVSVYVAHNTAYPNFTKVRSPLVPGSVYVKDDERSPRRIEGVPDVNGLDYWQHLHNPVVIEAQKQKRLEKEAYDALVASRRAANG